MEIKKILWPTDYSDNAKAAVPMVKSLLEKYGAKLYILHVHDAVTRYELMADLISKDQEELLRDKFQARTANMLKELCDEVFTEVDSPVVLALEGDPAEELLKAVRDNGIDMIVMATHGYSGLKRLAFGSVAESIVAHSPVPVVTIRADT